MKIIQNFHTKVFEGQLLNLRGFLMQTVLA